MKRILVLPSDHGGGRGHVSRAIHIGKRLQQLGHMPFLVLEKKHYYQGANAGVQTRLLSTRAERFVKYQLTRPFKPAVRLLDKIKQAPVFYDFYSLAYQIPRDFYLTPRLVRYRLNKLSRLVRETQPDAIIGDTHFLAYALAKKHNLPVIQITRQVGFPPQPRFLWWREQVADVSAPDALAPFRPLIDHLKLPGIEKIEDLLRGDRYLIPSIREMEPVDADPEKVFYSGPLVEMERANQNIPFLSENNEYPKIFITVGGGASRGRMAEFFDKLIAIFHQSDYRVLVSTGNTVPAEKYKNRSGNIHFENWVHGVSAIRSSDLVIFHGGYATMMEVLQLGKPALVLPSHTEQEGNGQRLKSVGCGRLARIYREPLEALTFEWPYGTYQMKAAFEFDLNRDEILHHVHELIYGSTLQAVRDFSAKFREQRENFNMEQCLDF